LRWAERVTRMEAIRSGEKDLVGKPEGKGLIRRPRYRREDNIRLDLGETAWQVVDWMHRA